MLYRVLLDQVHQMALLANQNQQNNNLCVRLWEDRA